MLHQNGNPKPHSFKNFKCYYGEPAGKNQKVTPLTNVCIQYTSKRDSNRVKVYNILVRPIFSMGTTLKQIFCKSQPLDTASCVLSNPDCCQICTLINNSSCSCRGTVYEIICKACTATMRYHGEAGRPLHHRISEHLRAANNPSSYPNNALAQYFARNNDMAQAKFEHNRS